MARGVCETYALTGFCLRRERCPFDHHHAISAGFFDKIRAAMGEKASFKMFRKRHDAMQAKIQRVETEIKRQYAAANALDLVVVMDCTGSMKCWIDAAKSSILGIIDSVKTTHLHATVRVGFVAYRDFCDGRLRIQSHVLTEDIASVRKFVGRLRAVGGGDGPEDIPGGLNAALEMAFTAAAKRVILVADAPCHGADFHNMKDDPASVRQAAAGPDIRAQMRTLARRGIDFTFIEIVPTATAKMAAILEKEYQKAVAADGLEREFLKVSLSQSGDAARFGPVVASAASSSLSASKMRSVVASADKVCGVSSYAHYGPSGQQSTTLVAISEDACGDDGFVEIAPMSPLDWSALDDAVAILAVRHSYHFRQGQEINWASIQLKHSTQATTIKLLPACFARGAMRSAHAMYDATMGKRFVAKVYYGRAAVDVARGVTSTGWSLEDDVKTQVVAKRLAVEFSLLPAVPDGVDFIFTSWYEIQDPTAYGLSASMAAFTAEPYIAGEYKKYNNNNGWIYESGSAAQLRDTAQAFSHFTWQRTYGQLMVVDLQGVGCIFTDPQIHSVDKHAFGRGNRAEAGMAAFFCTHKCNAVCTALGLIECTGSGSSRPAGVGGERGGGPGQRGVEGGVWVDTAATHEDKTMTCSCGLCGEILGVARSAFVRAYAKGREVHCDACAAKVAVREARVCGVCEETMEVATFWYQMKGMAVPTTCKKCKAAAARMKS